MTKLIVLNLGEELAQEAEKSLKSSIEQYAHTKLPAGQLEVKVLRPSAIAQSLEHQNNPRRVDILQRFGVSGKKVEAVVWDDTSLDEMMRREVGELVRIAHFWTPAIALRWAKLPNSTSWRRVYQT